MSNEESNDEARSAIWGHIADIRTCMMVTRDDGRTRARPMRGIARPKENAIWFFTERDTTLGDAAAPDPHVCLTYSDVRGNTYVSVSGQMTSVDDRKVIESLWSEGAEVYFAKGVDDPSIVLLKFVPEAAEYWDAPSSPILLAIGFLQAKITGERPDLGTSGAAQLS